MRIGKKVEENKTVRLINGNIIGLAEYGNPRGKPLFFFHGWPSSRLQAKVIDDSAKKLGIRVISIDRPGYGLSDFVEDRKLLDWPAMITEVADILKIKKFSVIGVSGGGPYAAVCAYKIPDRLIKVGIVVGLAPTDVKGVLEGMSFINKLAWRSYNSTPWLRELASLLHLSQVRKIIPYFSSLAFRAKADRGIMSKKVKEEMIRNREEAFRQGKKAVAQDLKIYTEDWGFSLSKIKSKVLLWYGADDKNVSVNMGKYYAEKIPNSELIIYPNEGHLLIWRHSEEILKSLTR